MFLLLVLEYLGAQPVVVGPAECRQRLLVLDEHERRHRGDVIGHCDVLAFVHVDLRSCHAIAALEM